MVGIWELTKGMVKEALWNGVEAVVNGEHKIRWHRKTSHHILEDQSLVLQFLPLRHCERRPTIAITIIIVVVITETHHHPSITATPAIHVFMPLLISTSPMNVTLFFFFNIKIKHRQTQNRDQTHIEPCRNPLSLPCFVFTPCACGLCLNSGSQIFFSFSEKNSVSGCNKYGNC